MSNVNTSDLLNFQDYSPEHNDRSARIDVEAVHTNQYNNTMSNPNYTYEEPTAIEEPEAAPPQSKFTAHAHQLLLNQFTGLMKNG